MRNLHAVKIDIN